MFASRTITTWKQPHHHHHLLLRLAPPLPLSIADTLILGLVPTLALTLLFALIPSKLNAQTETPPPWPGDTWRSQHRIIDLHQHINNTDEHVTRAFKILDQAGLGIGVNLSGGTVTHKPSEPSEFEKMKSRADRIAPGRYLHYFNLDYSGWDAPDFAERAARQVDDAKKLGAAGLKEFKRLGLFLRNTNAELIRIDDPKLDAVWRRCGELGMPVSIHIADPRAFWLPYNQQNERWTELKDHPRWWFGDPKQFPSREDLLAALDRVIQRHPKTTFVCVHFANNSEDLDWVDRTLDARPNMFADLAARIPELGRHNPDKVRQLFTKHQDRIFFATDFQVYNRLILGSSGDADKPTDADALEFYHKEWRWLETPDKNWPHMTPIQGNWTINSIALPPEVLRKIYFDNARKLLVRSLPATRVKASRITRDFKPDGKLEEPEWATSIPFPLEQHTQDGTARPEVSTSVRVLWSDQFLYLSYQCPFTELNMFNPVQTGERIARGQALWDKDVVELFVASNTNLLSHYTEYEWAPNGESLDLRIRLPDFNFTWNSGMESAVSVDHNSKLWRAEIRIPLTSLSDQAPTSGTLWRANFYRIDRAHKAFLASNPTLTGSFHQTDRFGWLEFLP